MEDIDWDQMMEWMVAANVKNMAVFMKMMT